MIFPSLKLIHSILDPLCPCFQLKNYAVYSEEVLDFLQISKGVGGCCGEDKEMNQFAINDGYFGHVVMGVKSEVVVE